VRSFSQEWKGSISGYKSFIGAARPRTVASELPLAAIAGLRVAQAAGSGILGIKSKSVAKWRASVPNWWKDRERTGSEKGPRHQPVASTEAEEGQ